VGVPGGTVGDALGLAVGVPGGTVGDALGLAVGVPGGTVGDALGLAVGLPRGTADGSFVDAGGKVSPGGNVTPSHAHGHTMLYLHFLPASLDGEHFAGTTASSCTLSNDPSCT
jgi:hypothetical protein